MWFSMFGLVVSGVVVCSVAGSEFRVYSHRSFSDNLGFLLVYANSIVAVWELSGDLQRA